MSADIEISMGVSAIRIKRKGQSEIVTANILGQTVEEGYTCWYLDRLVHASHEKLLGEYSVSGAVSSKLMMPAPK